MEKNYRIYPQCCTSMYCGKLPDSCPTCPNYAKQQDFEQWREKHAAKQPDHIWSPAYWEATR